MISAATPEVQASGVFLKNTFILYEKKISATGKETYKNLGYMATLEAVYSTLLNKELREDLEILNNIDNILGGDLEKIPEDIKNEYISRLKMIPFSSLGKQNGMLVGIKPEKVEIINEYSDVKDDVVIGIYNKSLTKRGEYNALIGIELY